jgi:hypothetical protein
MIFEEFQNRARLYVIGALYPNELAEFERATTLFGPKAETCIRDCCALRDAFALSVRPPSVRGALAGRLLSMARQRQRV